MRNTVAFCSAVTLVGLVVLAFIPCFDSGVPFIRDNRNITLTPRWLAILVIVIPLAYFAAGALATSIDRSGDTAKWLILFEVLSRSIIFVSKFIITPRRIPEGIDVASIEFREAWPYLLIPPWYILAYGLLAIAGLYLGTKIIHRISRVQT